MSPRWDVGKNLALETDAPTFGLDTFAPPGVDWSLDTTAVAQAAVDAAYDAGGGEVLVPNLGRIYRWLGLQMRSKVGLRFLGNPTIRKSGGAATTHIIEWLGSEDTSVSSPLVVDHPLASPLTVTGASWAAAVATVTVGSGHNLIAGDQVRVLSVTPTGYNHLATVTAVTSTTISYAVSSNPGSWTSGGSVRIMPYNVHPTSGSGFAVGDIVGVMDETFDYELSPTVAITAASWSAGIATVTFSGSPQTAAGEPIHVSGASPSGYNGVFMTLSRSGTTVTYALQTNPGSWSSGGVGIFCNGQNLELARVTAVTGNQLVLDHALKRTYTTSQKARLVRLEAVSDSYITGPVRIELADGTAGGNLYWRLAYDCRVLDVDCYGPNDDPAFNVQRSARLRLREVGAYEGQSVDLGGFGYGVSIGSSSHDIRVQGLWFERIRENNCGNGSMDIEFDGFHGMWIYDDAINTHGSFARRVRIANGQIGLSQAAGITVAFSTARGPDYDLDIENVVIYDVGGVGININGNHDGTKNIQGVRLRNVKVIRAGGSFGLQVNYADNVDIDGLVIEGDGISGQMVAYIANGSNVRMRNYDLDGGGSDYGLVWEGLTGAEFRSGSIRDVASFNLWGQSSTGVKLGPQVLDDTDVSLQGSEVLVGADALSGALSFSEADATLTPDPTYRYHVWSPTVSRTVNAPSTAKRAIGQRITFDITNAGVAEIEPVWDSAFKVHRRFTLSAP